MAKPTCKWVGASGAEYTYHIHERGPSVNPDQHGNYIYSKRNPKGQWVPIYIGEGDLSVRCSKSHHQLACLDTKDATHVHMHLNADEKRRKAEERDLLAHYQNAYTPSGCNIKMGG